MSTTEPIVIPIEGDASDFIADAKKIQSEMDKLASTLKGAGVSQSAYNKAMENSQGAAKKTSMSITDLRSSYMILMDVVRVGQQVWAATGQEFVNYAEQVKNMSRNTGVAAEDASRLIQVADDVRISFESLSMGMKIAQKQGIDVSVEGLAKLADRYNALPPGIARTQMLLKTFGKSGLEMGKMMEVGGEGILKMSAAVEKGLIVTEAGIKASDDYQASVDALGDAWKAFTVTVGSQAVPAVTKVIEGINLNIAAEGYLQEALKKTGGDRVQARHLAYEMAVADQDAAKALRDVARSADEGAPALEDNTAAVDAQKEAVKAATDALDAYKKQLDEVSQANTDNASRSQEVADFQKSYAADHVKATEAMAEAEAKLKEARAGGDTEGIAVAVTGVEEARQAVQSLEATWTEASNKMIYDMVQVGLSVDGLTDSELKALDAYAIKMGLKTQADVDEANKRKETADGVISSILQSEDVLAEQKKINEETARLESQVTAAQTSTDVANAAASEVNSMNTVTGSINLTTQAMVALGVAAGNTASKVAGVKGGVGTGTRGSGGMPAPAPRTMPRPGGGSIPQMDSGGYGVAGTPYVINGGAKPEVFIPATDGTFIPNADKKGLGGSTYNININNPVGQTAENSIRSALKRLSYVGVAA